jgi:hypothetical protein
MTSTLAWLDYSEEDQRRAREIVQLFMQPESRDELGIGVVRDALSDSMFPGISVVQTRARYFLFVPWLFTEGERRGHRGRALTRWVDLQERKLIESLRAGGEGGEGDGLIGRLAGVRLKILPSTIYWNGLHQFGILRSAASIEQVADLAGSGRLVDDAITEMVDRGDGLWDPSMPRAFPGFFKMSSATFDLEPVEADWLAERISSCCEGTLLGWLASRPSLRLADSSAPWMEPAVGTAPPEILNVVTHAELFSLVMHGAALLYNLLLAERCRELGIEAHADRVETYRTSLAAWVTEIEGVSRRLSSWDLADFWALVETRNPRVPVRTRLFIEQWISFITSGRRTDLADDPGARQLIRNREQSQKRGQARLDNERLLRQWGGEAGLARLNYRWPTAHQILDDIEQGRSRARA